MTRQMLLPLAAALATLPSLALAEQADGGGAAPEEQVIVTGTRQKDRTVLDSAVPVDVVDRSDIAAAAPVGGELGEALQSLVPSFNFPHQSNSGGADHVHAAQLRGMSPDQVLVLVNGKRRHTSAVVNLEAKVGKGTTPVDFNAIPSNAIKRIEVLRDGAGAQYGSDAIAGVVNVILDDSSSGGEATVSFGENRTKFDPTHQTLTDGRTWVAQLRHGFQLGNGGALSVGAEFRDRASTNRSGFDTIIFQADPTPANLATEGHRNYRPGDPQATDYSLWANSRLPLAGDSELHGFVTYNHRDSVGAAFFRYPDSSSNQVAVYPNGYRPETLGTSQDLGLSGGWSGTRGAWTHEASLTFGVNRFNYGLRHSLNASLGPTSPTNFHIGDYTFNQLTLNGDASRDLELGSAPAHLALGVEVRREAFSTSAGDPASYAAGPFTAFDAGAQAGPGLTPADAVSTHRTVGSLYGDLSVTPSQRVFLEAAARYEHYSDFGDAVAGKLSGRVELTKSVGLRAAASNSFRAPALSQVSFKSTSTSFGEGGTLSQVLTIPATSAIAQALGARPLKAEKSQNVSAGLTWNPARGIDFAIDGFYIKVKDRITISERISGTDLTTFINTNFGLTGIDGLNFFTNAVDTRTRGVDAVGSARLPLAGGLLKLTLAYAYADTKITGVNDTPAALQALGFNDVIIGVEERNTLEGAAPRTKTIASAEWSDTHWGATARLTHYGTAVRVFDFGGGFQPTQTYGAKNQLDAELEYKPLATLGLAIGASNLTDAYPDRSIDDISYAGNFPYDVLSPIGFNGAFYYARVRYGF